MHYLEALEKSPFGRAVRTGDKGDYKIKTTVISTPFPPYIQGNVEIIICGRRIVRKADFRDIDGFGDFDPET